MAYREALLTSGGSQDCSLLTPSYRFIVYGLSEPSCNPVRPPRVRYTRKPGQSSRPVGWLPRHRRRAPLYRSYPRAIRSRCCAGAWLSFPRCRRTRPSARALTREETHYHWATGVARRRHALVPSLLPCASIVRFSATKRKARGVACLEGATGSSIHRIAEKGSSRKPDFWHGPLYSPRCREALSEKGSRLRSPGPPFYGPQ